MRLLRAVIIVVAFGCASGMNSAKALTVNLSLPGTSVVDIDFFNNPGVTFAEIVVSYNNPGGGPLLVAAPNDGTLGSCPVLLSSGSTCANSSDRTASNNSFILDYSYTTAAGAVRGSRDL